MTTCRCLRCGLRFATAELFIQHRDNGICNLYSPRGLASSASRTVQPCGPHPFLSVETGDRRAAQPAGGAA